VISADDLLDSEDRSWARPDRRVRRSRNGNGHALCAFCNARLANLWHYVQLAEVDNPGAFKFFRRSILFSAEWTYDTLRGLWRVTNHTYKGKPSLRRIYKASPQQASQWRHMSHRLIVVQHPARQPVICECPQCHNRQILEPDRLHSHLYHSVPDNQITFSEDSLRTDEGWTMQAEWAQQVRELREYVRAALGTPPAGSGGQTLFLLKLERSLRQGGSDSFYALVIDRSHDEVMEELTDQSTS
jgi:hypothetical protein